MEGKFSGNTVGNGKLINYNHKSKTKDDLFSSIGNYKLTPTTLGKGSFSKVVLANHVILNKQVALKVVTLHKIKDPYVSKNLKREPAIMANLSHPNIVSLHEVVSVGDFYCMVLDFYPGGNLCDMIGSQEGYKLEEGVARSLFKQILAGLGYLHSKSIIHRDIKLENILLDKTQTKAVIADFGLSNFWDANTRLKTRCGSAEVTLNILFVDPNTILLFFSMLLRRSSIDSRRTPRPSICGLLGSPSMPCQ